nr:unnamed protein product [Callosobruchus chinensis]
MKRKIKVNR